MLGHRKVCVCVFTVWPQFLFKEEISRLLSKLHFKTGIQASNFPASQLVGILRLGKLKVNHKGSVKQAITIRNAALPQLLH